MPLWAVEGDPNTHGRGELIADNPKTVFINNIPVIENEDPASPDLLCGQRGQSPLHCSPSTSEGSPNVFVYNNPVHRAGDDRVCGATTIVTNQTNVFVNEV
jgi:uncharacterized Zn-binding protein involved in type VI secretion